MLFRSGGSKFGWGNARIIGLFVVFGVLLTGFVVIQLWQQENATVPPRVLKQRSIWSGALWALCFGGKSEAFIGAWWLIQ